MNTLDAIRVSLAAASSAPDDVAILHLAQARTLLVSLESSVAEARRSLEAMEREHVRKSAAITVDGQ